MTLLQYHNNWYRSNQEWCAGRMMLQYFDTVVVMKDNNHYDVIKNQQTGITGSFGDTFLMKLFINGMTLNDIPLVTAERTVNGSTLLRNEKTRDYLRQCEIYIMGRTHGGKGDRPRLSQISIEEKDLRYELAFCKDAKRKRAILRKLKLIKKAEENGS